MTTRAVIIVGVVAVLAAVSASMLAATRDERPGPIIVNAPAPSSDGATATVPSVRVETDRPAGDVKVDAPYTRVEKDADGTRVQAPGVDVTVPPKSTE